MSGRSDNYVFTHNVHSNRQKRPIINDNIPAISKINVMPTPNNMVGPVEAVNANANIQQRGTCAVSSVPPATTVITPATPATPTSPAIPAKVVDDRLIFNYPSDYNIRPYIDYNNSQKTVNKYIDKNDDDRRRDSFYNDEFTEIVYGYGKWGIRYVKSRKPKLEGVATNYRNLAGDENHEYCNDDTHIRHLTGYNDSINQHVTNINNLVKKATPLYNTTVYDNLHKNIYTKRIASLIQEYNDLGDTDRAKRIVNDEYNPQIKNINDQKNVIDASLNTTNEFLCNFRTNTIPIAQSIKSTSVNAQQTSSALAQFVTGSANNNMGEYYNSIHLQNSILKDKMEGTTNFSVENDRKSEYNLKSLNKYKSIYYYLFIFYYIFVFIFCAMSYFTKTRFEFIIHLMIAGFLVIFPYIIYSVELMLYNSWIYIFSILTGTMYKPYDPINNDTTDTSGQKLNAVDDKRNNPVLTFFAKRIESITSIFIGLFSRALAAV